MPQFNQPDCLEHLALNAVVKFVKNFSIDLISLVQSNNKGKELVIQEPEKLRNGCFQNILHAINRLFAVHDNQLDRELSPIPEHYNLCSVQEICYPLQNMLHNLVVPSLANDLTAKVLQIFGELVYSNMDLLCEPWQEEVLLQLVTAVISPSVTRLKLTYHLHDIAPMVCATLGTLVNLEELELCFVSDISDLRMLAGVIDNQLHRLVVTGLRSLVKLKSFKFPCNCTDNIVISLGKSCKYLKCLDFNCSRVTDTSIDSILHLNYLLDLNFSRTSISEEGCTYMLNNMAQNNVTLRSFGCSAITGHQLDILVNRFTQLTQVTLVSFDQDLVLLEELKDLQVLRLRSGHFRYVSNVIVSSGWRLLLLELARVNGVDVKLIGEKCPNLTNLTLRCCNARVPVINSFDEPLMGFHNLKDVALHTKNDTTLVTYILSQCLNAGFVSINSITGINDRCIHKILKKNQFHFLKELNIEIHGGELSLLAVRKFVEHSKNLTLLKGMKTWGSDDDTLRTFVKEMKTIHPCICIL